ncbi:DUF1127 domain-containing protein [Rhizobium sp. BK068]|uniref:DUF1127 domain-containing protein n=1 Tax=Rhizobium sp. BK068 TaxID=2512130 RepID=UPI001052E430|nr:DUF1127 domain-containing protein [Rhizobium sp. BK068]TCM76988.1 uncharacterized protein DUF1127 [Rhizobium sp. BK068]
MTESIWITSRPEVTRRLWSPPRIVKAAWAAIVRCAVRRSAVARLRDLDGDALKDIGLARSEIEKAAYGLITRPRETQAVSGS